MATLADKQSDVGTGEEVARRHGRRTAEPLEREYDVKSSEVITQRGILSKSDASRRRVGQTGRNITWRESERTPYPLSITDAEVVREKLHDSRARTRSCGLEYPEIATISRRSSVYGGDRSPAHSTSCFVQLKDLDFTPSGAVENALTALHGSDEIHP
jgi:hypothetical protein